MPLRALWQELDLSQNSLKRIEGLHGLESLKRLVLANNEIERIEGLESLEALETLQLQARAHTHLRRHAARRARVALANARRSRHALSLPLQGNRVSNLDDAQCLTGLQCLRHFQLQSKSGEERNPMCEHPAYRTALRRMLPRLQTLDGERTVLADAALPKEASSALAELAFAEPEP